MKNEIASCFFIMMIVERKEKNIYTHKKILFISFYVDFLFSFITSSKKKQEKLAEQHIFG